MARICRKCGNGFKIRQVIDGKERHLGSRKFCLTCSPFGSKNTRPTGPLIGSDNKVYYRRRKPTTEQDRRRSSLNVINWRRKAKRILIEYKGGKCVKCGYNKDCPGAYDLHHRDPSQKEFGISGMTRNLELMKKEADKCDLLCKNCHAELHYSSK